MVFPGVIARFDGADLQVSINLFVILLLGFEMSYFFIDVLILYVFLEKHYQNFFTCTVLSKRVKLSFIHYIFMCFDKDIQNIHTVKMCQNLMQQ